jgi:hypothetical protein
MGKTFHILEKDFIAATALLQHFRAQNPQLGFSALRAQSWRCARRGKFIELEEV